MWTQREGNGFSGQEVVFVLVVEVKRGKIVILLKSTATKSTKHSKDISSGKLNSLVYADRFRSLIIDRHLC